MASASSNLQDSDQEHAHEHDHSAFDLPFTRQTDPSGFDAEADGGPWPAAAGARSDAAKSIAACDAVAGQGMASSDPES
jgi:hypothetical protein